MNARHVLVTAILVTLAVVAIHGSGVQAATAASTHDSRSTSGSMPAGVAVSAPVGSAASVGSYTHTGAASPAVDLPPGNGDIMPSSTIYYVFWLPTGQHFGSNSTDDTNYENLLIQWANDLGGSQFHNLVTQYNGNNGTISNTVSFGGSWTDTNAYPHAGTSADPIQDGDIRQAIRDAVAANGWTENISHFVAVFTANGIFECASFGCMSDSDGFCAYHDHFSDSGNDVIYAFMGYDDFEHHVGRTCVAGQTAGDNDPNRGVYPNGNRAADAEINTLSHELIEAETDPHPNDTWTAPNPEGEIGDACNFNFSPRSDVGADVYINGHGYIMQQEYSNSAHTCAIDLPTNGFCGGSVANVCSPTTSFAKSVDNPNPRVLSTIHYTLSLDNTNDTGAETNLALTDTVPAGYAVTGLSAPNSTSSSNTASSITVNYDTLAPHTSRTVTVTATVPTQAGTTATNCGTLNGQDLLQNNLSPLTSSPCASTTPIKIPTVVTNTGPTTDEYHDPVTVSARLTDDASNPLSGKQLTFTLNGAETCSGSTDGTGTASCSITPHEVSGTYTLQIDFADSTDPVYATSTTSVPFAVTTEETTMKYTGPTVILGGGGGATLTATMLEDGTGDNDSDGGSAAPIPSETVTLSIGSQSCTDTTDGSGNVSCTIPSVNVPLGPETVGASFAGDGYYKPSSDTTNAIVFAFPDRGAFVLGDTTAATAGSSTVTWWAATWSSLNNLTGGDAPASFKGFAGVITLPTTSPPVGCGSSWTTTGGNSPPPTKGVPTYMGVVVAGNVTKSGNTISGDSEHIVVVQTNPGYSPNPGHHGTGRIVATFC
jgi:uncharacterized repeat protein (TIGR01451 family)